MWKLRLFLTFTPLSLKNFLFWVNWPSIYLSLSDFSINASRTGIFETDEAPSHAPHCNIFIDLGSDVEIAYGPWADAQRLILMEFFYPIDYRIAEVT